MRSGENKNSIFPGFLRGEPHLTSNKDHHHGEAVAPSVGMGLVGPLDPMQGRASEVLAEATVEGFGKI